MAAFYNFLVAHYKPGHDLDMLGSYLEMRNWMQRMGCKVDRCGGKNGSVVKYSEGKYVRELEAGKLEAVELYSERVLQRGEVRETLNCECSAVLAKSEGLVLSISSEKMKTLSLVDSFFENPEWCRSFDYGYALSESHAYGFGYAQGIHIIDDEHPLTWSGGDETIMWLKMQWAGTQDLYIRDVYPVNLFSSRKLSAFPEYKLSKLKSVMSRYGECSVKEGFTVWAMDENERVLARKELSDVDLIAACMS